MSKTRGGCHRARVNQHGPSVLSIHVYVCIVSFGIHAEDIPVGLASAAHSAAMTAHWDFLEQ